MLQAQPKTFVKSSLIARQEREQQILLKLYETMPVGVEQRGYSAVKIAKEFGYSYNQMQRFAMNLAKLGILTRRIEFAANVDGKVRPGRSAHWTLNLPMKEAVDRLEAFHDQERSSTDHAPAPSLKNRVLTALESQPYSTVDDLALAVTTGSRVDHHNLTHVLYSLKRENKITFDNGTTKDRIPFNIQLRSTKKPKAERKARSSEQAMFEARKILHPEEFAAPDSIIVGLEPVKPSEEFPAIVKLVNRKAMLEQAAKLAEDADETDLAIRLYEKADKALSEFEQEVVALYEAYIKAKDSSIYNIKSTILE